MSAVDATQLRAVWWRRPQPFALHDDVRSPQDRGFAHGEIAAAVSGLWSCLGATWVNDPDRDEVPRVVHEELGRLPERLRAPIVLCYLEGMTHDRAAQQLGCPVGTVRSRLARARALLHRRIARRGLVASSVAIGAVLATDAWASAVSPHIPRSLVKAAARQVWAFFVQRELCGLRDQKQIIKDYAMPGEVLVRLGAIEK